jgi:hypothetical protein
VGTKSEVGSSSLERAAYSIPEFCFRNNISRPTYHRLRSQGRGPKEMRLGLNNIRITAAAERDWQCLMQEPRADLEIKATARAVKAGDAAIKSSKHISKQTAGRSVKNRKQQRPVANPPASTESDEAPAPVADAASPAAARAASTPAQSVPEVESEMPPPALWLTKRKGGRPAPAWRKELYRLIDERLLDPTLSNADIARQLKDKGDVKEKTILNALSDDTRFVVWRKKSNSG